MKPEVTEAIGESQGIFSETWLLPLQPTKFFCEVKKEIYFTFFHIFFTNC
jgi:hypothetical protein